MTEEKTLVSFLGFGAFNSAIAHYFDKEGGIMMRFWDKSKEVREAINKERKHPYHFSDIAYSNRIRGVDKIEELREADFLIIGVPAQRIRESIKPLKGLINNKTIIVVVSKGLEIGSNKRPSQVIKEELGEVRVAVFAGGTTASDISNGIPLIAEVASVDKEARERVANLFHSKKLRIYTNPDILSVELSSALKNVVSIGAGICDGLSNSIGTKAAFITRATRDIYKIARALGADEKTFLPGSASVWGDIILSSFGITRNYDYGRRICKKKPQEVLREMQEEHKTVEGYYTTLTAHDISKEMNVDTPCIQQIYRVIYEDLEPRRALEELFERDRRGIE